MNLAVSFLVLLVSTLLHSFVDYVYAVNQENDEKLARKFAPILVLTENPTDQGRRYKVINPEPVKIMGANSVSNVQVVLYKGKPPKITKYYSGPIISSPFPIQERFPKVNFKLNKFAFLTGYNFLIYHDLNISLRTYFNYPGTDADSWYDAYFSEKGDHAGWRFPNTSYAHIFERDSSDIYGPVVIKYYFFYPFNHWENNHEGDWPSINVIVTDRDPDVAKLYGIDYTFHGKGITYYNVTDNPSATNNIRESIAPVGGQYPVIYVSAGGHGSFPTPGHYENGGQGPPGTSRLDVDEDLTPYGVVLHPEIVDSDENKDIGQSYNIVLLPDPENILDNMGLAPEMSWLGAYISWGDRNVPSWPIVDNNGARGPFYSGWNKIRYDNESREDYPKSDIPYAAFHNFPIVGDVTWRGTISLLGDIVVFPGATLTIAPGTVIEFAAGVDSHRFPKGAVDRAEIFVYGTLQAEGTVTNSIRIQRTPGRGDDPAGDMDAWGGIWLMEGGSLDLAHTAIRNVLPGQPTALQAKRGDGKAVLTWLHPVGPNPDVVSYHAGITHWEYKQGTLTKSRKDTSWTGWLPMKSSDATTHQFTVAGLTNGVRYAFQVRSATPTSWSLASESSGSVVPAGRPEPPEVLTETDDGQVKVSWSAGAANGSAIEQHELRYSADGGRTWVQDWTVYQTVFSQLFTRLFNGTEYTFELRAKNGVGYSLVVSVQATPGYPLRGPSPVSYSEGGKAAVASYWLDRRGSFLWSLSGLDAAAFRLAGRQLYFRTSPDFERPIDRQGPTDLGGNNRYQVTVWAKPDLSRPVVQVAPPRSYSKAVVVEVKNVEEEGTVKLPSSPPRVGRPFTAELQDPDGQITGACWTWQRAEDAKKRWTDLTSCDEVRAFAGDAEATAYPELSSYTPTAKDAGWLLRARVIYRDGQSGTEYRRVFSAASGPVVSGALTLEGPDNVLVAENTTKVGLYETNAAAGTALDWSLIGADEGFFELREGTTARELHFASPPNYEKPTDRDGKNTYEVKVIVGDGTLKASVEAVVHVRDADDEGVITLSTTAPQVGDAVTATLTDEDGIRNGTVSWGWTYQRVPEEEFSAWDAEATRTETHPTRTITIPARHVGQRLRFYARYRDVFDQQTAKSDPTDPIRPAPNRAPTLSGAATAVVAENSTSVADYEASDPDGDRLEWSLRGADESFFELGTGTAKRSLQFKAEPNFEQPPVGGDNTYEVTIEVSDGTLQASVAVTVTVADADDEGVITFSTTQPKAGQKLKATLTDEDGGIEDATWGWNNAEASATSTGVDVLTSTTLVESAWVGDPVRVMVWYTDALGSERDEAEGQTLAVVADVPAAPGNLAETAGHEQVVLSWTTPDDHGAAITGYDYRYSIDGGITWQPDWTEIDGSTKDTTTYPVLGLTNEVEYTLEVRAVNGQGAGAAAQVKSTPYAPFVIEGDETPTVEENKTEVGTYTTNAPAGTVISWSVDGTDESAFSITAMGGALSFSSAPNYESPTDSNTDNDYVIEVIAATDDYTPRLEVTVTVSNQDEKGQISLTPPTTPQVGQTITALLTDPDGGINGALWDWTQLSAGTEQAVEADADEVQAASAELNNYTPKKSDIGYPLRAYVFYNDDHDDKKEAETITAAVIDVPDAPVVSADGGDGQATIEWTVPNNNGSEIEAYEYRYKDSAWSIWKPVSSSTTTVTIPDLTNEVEYTFAVRAINEAGAGPAGQDTAKPQPPFVIEGDKAPTVEENKTAVGTYTTNAPAGTVISWSVGGTDASAFSITATGGALSFDPAPNYEAPTDSNTDNDYVVEVIAATDDYTPRLEVTVTVSNQDEEGHVSLTPPTTPQVGQTITALLTDPDGGINGAEWDWKQFHGGTEQAVEADDDQVQAASAELNNYTPKKSDIGRTLRADVSYNDDHGDDKKKAKSEITAAVIDVPDAPSVSTSAGDGRVTVSWTAPNNNGSVITGYAYRDSSHAGTTWTPWTSVSSSTRSTTRSGLTNGTTYTFQVRAKNSAGDGPAGKATATPVSPLVLCGPRSLSDSAGNAQVSLSWSNPTGSNCAPIWRYEYRYRSSGGSWSGWSSVGTATSKTVTGLTNGTSYEFAVRAVTSLGDTSPLTVTATPVAPPPPPNRAPTITAGPASASVAENTTSVADYDATDPDGDAISWSATGAFSISSSGGLRFSSPPNYESGTTSYSTTVTARDPDGLSDTKSVSITVTNAEDTGTISLSPNPPQVGQTLQATLTDEDGGLKDVLWGATATGQASVEPQSHSWSTTFAVSRSWLGQPVRVIVSYRDALGPGKTAQTTSAAVVAGPPGAPRNLTATQVPPGYSQIGLTWSAPQSDGGSAIQHYEYQKNADPWSNIGNTTSYTASGLTGGTSYTFSIRAVNGVNKTGPSASVTLATRAGEVAEGAGKPVSLQRALADSVLAVVVAPNPFNPTTTLHLHLPADSPVKLVIYNMAGQRVQTVLDSRLQAGYHTFHWDGRDALGRATTSGVYLYRVHTPTQTLVGKMVLIR